MKVLGMHYWDTRHRVIAPYWPLNIPLVRNTFEVVSRNLPPDWTLEHHIMLDEVEKVPEVRELAEEWGELHIHKPERTGTRHFFNDVALSCYDILEDRINASDLVLGMSQDRFLINYYDTNLLVLMHEMMQGQHPALAHQRNPPYNYISHTIPVHPEWHRWNHNAGSGVGLWHSHRLPIIREAHTQGERAGEVYLHRTLGEHCLYMKLNPWIYMGDYRMGHLTPTRVEFLMEFTRDQGKMARLIAVCEQQWCASLHPFWNEVL